MWGNLLDQILQEGYFAWYCNTILKNLLPSKILQGNCQALPYSLVLWIVPSSSVWWALSHSSDCLNWSLSSSVWCSCAEDRCHREGGQIAGCWKTLISKIQESSYLQLELINIQGQLPSQHLSKSAHHYPSYTVHDDIWCNLLSWDQMALHGKNCSCLVLQLSKTAPNRSVILQSSRPRKSMFQVSELQPTNCRCNQHSMLYVGLKSTHARNPPSCFFPESGNRSHTEAAGIVPLAMDNDVNILWTGWAELFRADQATLNSSKWFNHLLNTFQPCTHSSSSCALEVVMHRYGI